MIRFAPETHTYSDNLGELPSVTTILKRLGIVEFKYVSEEDLSYKQELGTAVHEMLHLYDTDNLGKCPPDLEPYLDGWIKFKKDTGCQILESEKIVWSKRYRFAGTLDRKMILYGEKTIVDIKTGVNHPSGQLQTGGYLLADNEMIKKKAEQAKNRALVYLPGNGNYKIVNCPDRNDPMTFLACFSVYNWLKSKRR